MGLRPIDSVTHRHRRPRLCRSAARGLSGAALSRARLRHRSERVAELARGMDRTREVTRAGVCRGRAALVFRRAARAARRAISTSSPCRRRSTRPSSPISARWSRPETVGQALSPGDVVVYEFDRLSRRDRGGLRADPGAGLRARLQPRFLRRLFARADQSRRPDPSPVRHRQGHLGLDARGRRSGRCRLCRRHHRRHASRELDPRRRGRQGDREHPARRQHRADQRARQLFKRLGLETREVLEAAGTKWNFHAYRPALSAATASASIPITSPTRRNRSASIRR